MTKLAPLLAGPTSSATADPPTSLPPGTPPSSEGAAAARLSLLHLLARLLSLDAQRVLMHNPSQHSFDFLFNSYCSFLTARLALLVQAACASCFCKLLCTGLHDTAARVWYHFKLCLVAHHASSTFAAVLRDHLGARPCLHPLLKPPLHVKPPSLSLSPRPPTPLPPVPAFCPPNHWPPHEPVLTSLPPPTQTPHCTLLNNC